MPASGCVLATGGTSCQRAGFGVGLLKHRDRVNVASAVELPKAGRLVVADLLLGPRLELPVARGQRVFVDLEEPTGAAGMVGQVMERHRLGVRGRPSPEVERGVEE